MRFRLLGSSLGSADTSQFLMSVLVNDTMSLDAGSLGFAPLAVQRRVETILLTHSHLDHIASLPIFLDNVLTSDPDCPTVYANASVLSSLQTHVFNDAVWPDLMELESDFVKLRTMSHLEEVDLGEICVTPVELNHVLPTFGFILKDNQGTVGFVTDTSPTEKVWEILNETPDLRALFLETSFPARMSWLAEKAFHLTPQLMAEELQKLNHKVPVYIVHLKAAFRAEVEQEIKALALPNVEIVVPEKEYDL